MEEKPISLGIAEDSLLFVRILKEYLTGEDDIIVKVQACSYTDLLDKLKRTRVDVLLMDLFLSKHSGFDVIKMLQDECPNTKILVLSVCRDLNTVSSLLDSGIHGYLSKSDEPEELLNAIRAVSKDRLYRNKLFTDALYWNKENQLSSEKNTSLILDDREKLILELLWEEKTNKEIADAIFLSTRSVEKIRQNMKEKLNVRSTVGLIKYGIRNSIIKDKENTTRITKSHEN